MGDEQYEGYDRVSSILDFYQPKGLIDWKIKTGKREANRISKIATNIGTNVDDYIRAWVLEKKVVGLKTQESKNCVRAFFKFLDDYGFKREDFRCGERLFNKEEAVCGEPDILIPKRKEVLDLKCSASIRPTYWLQNNWYCKNLGYSSRSILRLDKNLGIYEYEVRPYSDKDTSVFNSLKECYRYFKEIEQSSKGE